MSKPRTYPGFPNGINESFLRHVADDPSQCDDAWRALAAELLWVRTEQTDERKQIADAISALRAAKERADIPNTSEALRELDTGVRSALAILTRHDPREPMPAFRGRAG